MSSTNYFNIAAIKVFTDLYEFIKVDEMLQEYESNYIESNNNVIEAKNIVIESKPKKQKKQINEDYKKFGHNITTERVILNQYDFEKINKLTPEKYVIETQKNKNNSIKNIKTILDKYNKNDSKTFLEKTKEYNIFIEYPELDKNYDKFIDSCEKSILKNDNYLLPSKFKNEFFSNTNDNQAFILINNKCNHLIIIKYQPNN